MVCDDGCKLCDVVEWFLVASHVKISQHPPPFSAQTEQTLEFSHPDFGKIQLLLPIDSVLFRKKLKSFHLNTERTQSKT
jgi:hypothetical protein